MAEADRPIDTDDALQRVLQELHQLVGFHISVANTTIKAHFQQNHARLGLTQKQIGILWLIGGVPGIIQVDLARLLRVKRATMSAMIRALETRGLVTREAQGEVDARHVPLELTGKGREALREAKQDIARHEEWVKGHFTAEERRQVAELMKRIYEERG